MVPTSAFASFLDSAFVNQAVDRIEQLLRDCPTGEVWAVVGYASAAGLRWLDERTIGRPVRLLIGDTRTGFAKDKVSAEDRAGAMRFINRPDVRITNWYRRKGGYRTVHAKAWAVMSEGVRGHAAGVVVGSANLTKQGLHHNTELVARVVGDEAQRIVREMEAALDESWDTKANLLKRLEGGPRSRSQAGRGRSSPSGRKSHRTPAPVVAPSTATRPHAGPVRQPPGSYPYTPSPVATGSAGSKPRPAAGPGSAGAADACSRRPAYAPNGSQSAEINGAARAALAFGIVAFFSVGLTAPFGVVMGHIGRRRGKRLAGKGRRLAMAGLICSYVCLPAFARLWLLPLINGA